jgi:hypothetical protein
LRASSREVIPVPEPLPDKPRIAGGFDFWAAALVNVMQTDTVGRPKVMGVALRIIGATHFTIRP